MPAALGARRETDMRAGGGDQREVPAEPLEVPPVLEGALGERPERTLEATHVLARPGAHARDRRPAPALPARCDRRSLGPMVPVERQIPPNIHRGPGIGEPEPEPPPDRVGRQRERVIERMAERVELPRFARLGERGLELLGGLDYARRALGPNVIPAAADLAARAADPHGAAACVELERVGGLEHVRAHHPVPITSANSAMLSTSD